MNWFPFTRLEHTASCCCW